MALNGYDARIRRTEVQMSTSNRSFIVQATYRDKIKHTQVTLSAYRCSDDVFELLVDSETEHDYPAGGEEYVYEEWIKRNQKLIQDGLECTNLIVPPGSDKWKRFIS
jgi:hypothetical protein